MTVYLKDDEFNAALILRHSTEDTDYFMSWEDSWIEFRLLERDVGDTDEEVLDTFEANRDSAIDLHYRHTSPRWMREDIPI